MKTVNSLMTLTMQLQVHYLINMCGALGNPGSLVWHHLLPHHTGDVYYEIAGLLCKP